MASDDPTTAPIKGRTRRATLPVPIYTAFGEDEFGWDIEGDGNPGIGITASAIQVWAMCQMGGATIGEAAAAFNLPLPMIVQAVEYHTFMFLEGAATDPGTFIEHEGE